jgi:hypothetical protein
LCHPNQLRQRSGPHLLHDSPALDFNGKFGGASGLRVQRSPATVRRPAYGYPWNRGPTFANQEIEIHTLICLQNVVVKSRYQPRARGSGNPRSSQNLRWVRPLALNFPTNSAIYIRATPERRTCVGKHRTGRARKPSLDSNAPVLQHEAFQKWSKLGIFSVMGLHLIDASRRAFVRDEPLNAPYSHK